MSKRRGNSLMRAAPEPVLPANKTEGKVGSAKGVFTGGQKSKLRQAVFRLLVVVGLPLVLLAGMEGVLRVFGYGYDNRFFIKMKGTDAYTTNPKFGWRFSPREIATAPYPVILGAKKEPGTKRVFILGESAAQGTPVPAFGFGRMLDVACKTCYPDAPVEIVNVAMRGINSHGILPIARECARFEPDVFLIYMGNNEAIGLHAPSPGGLKWPTPLWVLRTAQCLRETKLGQLLLNTTHKLLKSKPAVWLSARFKGMENKEKREQDMEFFRNHRLALDDPRRGGVYNNFRANLSEILQVTRRSGAKVILCTVAGNLVDFPPLGSLHREKLAAADLAKWEQLYKQGIDSESGKKFEEAMARYLEAAKLDDHFAELHFRLARCYLGGGKTNEALHEFELARDWDALQMRTDGRLNGIIRDLLGLAKNDGRPGEVLFLDAEEIFAKQQLAGGPPLFHEHVHLTFDGDYLLARTTLPAVAAALGKKGAAQAFPTRAECAAALAYSEWDEIGVAGVVARLTSKPPFLDQLEHAARQAQVEAALQARSKQFHEQGRSGQVLEFYRNALAQRPKDWQIHMNLGLFLSQIGDQKASAGELDQAVKLMPQWASLRTLLAQALVKSGRRGAAVEQLQEALKVDPDCGAAKEGLKML